MKSLRIWWWKKTCMMQLYSNYLKVLTMKLNEQQIKSQMHQIRLQWTVTSARHQDSWNQGRLPAPDRSSLQKRTATLHKFGFQPNNSRQHSGDMPVIIADKPRWLQHLLLSSIDRGICESHGSNTICTWEWVAWGLDVMQDEKNVPDFHWRTF